MREASAERTHQKATRTMLKKRGIEDWDSPARCSALAAAAGLETAVAAVAEEPKEHHHRRRVRSPQ